MNQSVIRDPFSRLSIRPERHILEEGQIRLLYIEKDTIELEGRLEVYDLYDAPEFCAISYAWSRERPTATIYCNRQAIPIRPSLLRGLKAITKVVGKRVYLWVDAVCIAQHDDDEKADQVKEMHNIFRYAKNVLIWVGESADDSDLVIDNMKSLNRRMRDLISIPDLTDEALTRRNLPILSDPIWYAIGAFFTRTWFQRLWTLQEALLARRADLICGDRRIDLREAVDLDRYLRRTNTLHIIDDVLQDEMRRTWDRGNFSSLGDLHKDSELTVAQLLRKCVTRDCSEPLDRVYGVLGLFPEHVRTRMPVDYSDDNRLQYWKVWMQAARLAIDSDSQLTLLHHTPPERSMNELPSWCPHLACRAISSSMIYAETPPVLIGDRIQRGRHRNVKAGVPDTRDEVRRDVTFPEPHILRVSGVVVDEIEEVLDNLKIWRWTYWNWPNSPDRRLGAWRQWIKECHKMATEAYKDVPGGLDPVAFSRTIIARKEDTIPGFTDLLYDTFRESLEADKYLPEHGQSTDDPKHTEYMEVLFRWYMDSISHLWPSRVFFRTKQGRIGLGSLQLRRGDTVTVLFGGRTCYALRRRPGSNPTRWEFLHESYVYGLMAGQVFGMLQRGQVRERYFDID